MSEPELSVPLHWSTSGGVRQTRILSQYVCVYVCVALCDILGLDERSYWQSGSPSHWRVFDGTHTARHRPQWPSADTKGWASDNVLLFVLPRNMVCWGWAGGSIDKVGVLKPRRGVMPSLTVFAVNAGHRNIHQKTQTSEPLFSYFYSGFPTFRHTISRHRERVLVTTVAKHVLFVSSNSSKSVEWMQNGSDTQKQNFRLFTFRASDIVSLITNQAGFICRWLTSVSIGRKAPKSRKMYYVKMKARLTLCQKLHFLLLWSHACLI